MGGDYPRPVTSLMIFTDDSRRYAELGAAAVSENESAAGTISEPEAVGWA